MTNNAIILWRPVPQSVSSPNFHLEPFERRYFFSAQLDPTFGDQGHAFAPGAPGSASPYSFFAIQPDGRMILSGNSARTQAAVLQRLLANGTLDPSFYPPTSLDTLDSPQSGPQIRLQPDGKILLFNQQGIIRLDADGSLDPTFHYPGTPIPQEDYSVYDVALLPNGQILTAGSQYRPDLPTLELLNRYNSDGSLDLTFGQDGVVTPLPDGILADAIRVTSDGHLLLISERESDNVALLDGTFWQLNSDGSVDPTFGDGGQVVLSPAYSWACDSFVWPQDAILLQSDGKIILGLTLEWPDGLFTDFVDELVRLTPDGAIDPTFGNGGVAEINADAAALDMVLQPDGKIVVVLDNLDQPDSPTADQATGLLRLNSDGSPDTTYGPDGIFLITGTHYGYAQALVQGEKIILLANDTDRISVDPGQFFHVIRIEDVTARAPGDSQIPPAPASVPLPRWSEKPIFQDATDDLDWSQLKQPWD